MTEIVLMVGGGEPTEVSLGEAVILLCKSTPRTMRDISSALMADDDEIEEIVNALELDGRLSLTGFVCDTFHDHTDLEPFYEAR